MAQMVMSSRIGTKTAAASTPNTPPRPAAAAPLPGDGPGDVPGDVPGDTDGDGDTTDSDALPAAATWVSGGGVVVSLLSPEREQ